MTLGGCHFGESVIQDCGHCLACRQSLLLVLMNEAAMLERLTEQGTEGGTGNSKKGTLEELSPDNNHINEIESGFFPNQDFGGDLSPV